MIEIVIDKVPVAQARARPGKFGRFYNPNHADKMRWKFIIGPQMKKLSKLTPGAPLKVEATFYLPIAESLSEAKRRALDGQWHTNKPDIDNLIKFGFDVMSKIVYDDDRFIACMYIEKVFSLVPMVVFRISELGRRSEITPTCLATTKAL
jgi:Holliday junction resolvase RusA-like endonuclease